MKDVPSLIDIIHNGLNQLTDADKKSIKYQIESSRISPSLYIYKTTASGSLNILRVSNHLPHMQGLVRSGNTPRPSADDSANVSIDFYVPKEKKSDGKTSGKKKKFIKNKFDNHVGVPITIPTVEPFTVTSYEYSYKNLEQQDEMIIWHCIAAWISCLKPDRVFHDPFAQDEVKKAKVETKIANVKVYGKAVEITESNKNMRKIITESQLKQIIKETVRRVLNEGKDANQLADAFMRKNPTINKNGLIKLLMADPTASQNDRGSFAGKYGVWIGNMYANAASSPEMLLN